MQEKEVEEALEELGMTGTASKRLIHELVRVLLERSRTKCCRSSHHPFFSFSFFSPSQDGARSDPFSIAAKRREHVAEVSFP